MIEKIRDEFHYFMQETPLLDPHHTVTIVKEAPPELPSMVAVKLLENAAVYRLGPRQYVDYFGEALTVWDRQERKVTIHSLSEDRLFELGFLAIHSLLGQELDRDGLCRVHALGVSLDGVNLVIMLPSKGGKSTLLRHFLENPEVKIISDDMPLIDLKGRVHAFPSKIGLDRRPTEGPLAALQWHEFKRHHFPPKWTASLSQFKGRLDDRSVEHKTVLIAGFRLSSGQSILTEVSKVKIFPALLEHMIMGIGLPQVLELFLRFNVTDVVKLAYHAAIRTWAALQLLRRSSCYHFYMGPDRAYNAQQLLDLMYEHQPS